MNVPRVFAAVPAAGIGARAGGDLPKQYRALAGRRVIEHTLARLADHPRVERVAVAVRADDPCWPAVMLPAGRDVVVVEGGAERCHSVVACLRALGATATASDWVLVHDAVRPCLRATDIDRLLDEAGGHAVGGILALPVRDTMKRADAAGDVAETVDRSGLWHALTPQMFRFGALLAALEACIASGTLPTDEAQAMERAGARPRLVAGHADNIKITQPGDFALAELYLRAQAEEGR